jgi:hypothetical protein
MLKRKTAMIPVLKQCEPLHSLIQRVLIGRDGPIDFNQEFSLFLFCVCCIVETTNALVTMRALFIKCCVGFLQKHEWEHFYV